MAKWFCRLSAPGRTGRQTGMLMLFKRLKADFYFQRQRIAVSSAVDPL
ncbi:hypothetical protein EJP617_31620 [Erwinia sp. Ejp617]|nr:hypothetical protein EJP617_31620 [Erwinia sp. Ejp617]